MSIENPIATIEKIPREYWQEVDSNLPKVSLLEIRIKLESAINSRVFPNAYNPTPGIEQKEVARYFMPEKNIVEI